jgi:hypothetical protein
VPPLVPAAREHRSLTRKTERFQEEGAPAAPETPVESSRASVRREVHPREISPAQASGVPTALDRELPLPASEPVERRREDASRHPFEGEVEAAAVVSGSESVARKQSSHDQPPSESFVASPFSPEIEGPRLQPLPEPLVPAVGEATIAREHAAASEAFADKPGTVAAAGPIVVVTPDVARAVRTTEPMESRPPTRPERPWEESPVGSHPAPQLPSPQTARDSGAPAPLWPAPRDASASTVKVTIGRIEVGAAEPPQPTPPREPPQPRRPALSLDDYLKRRNGGSR